jgi:hypothetical protein
MKARLARTQVESDPKLLWNTFINLIADHPSNLDPEQRPAHFVFVYESEVQNGGHLQYFENQGTDDLDETLAALGLIGADCHQQVLRGAAELFLNSERSELHSAEDYVEAALEDEFGAWDARFHDCATSLIDSLKDLLVRHPEDFVEIAEQ